MEILLVLLLMTLAWLIYDVMNTPLKDAETKTSNLHEETESFLKRF